MLKFRYKLYLRIAQYEISFNKCRQINIEKEEATLATCDITWSCCVTDKTTLLVDDHNKAYNIYEILWHKLFYTVLLWVSYVILPSMFLGIVNHKLYS